MAMVAAATLEADCLQNILALANTFKCGTFNVSNYDPALACLFYFQK
jgi:hypothetical protein